MDSDELFSTKIHITPDRSCRRNMLKFWMETKVNLLQYIAALLIGQLAANQFVTLDCKLYE
jgi:hypothetical protein